MKQAFGILAVMVGFIFMQASFGLPLILGGVALIAWSVWSD
jgi:hypothetical protein